ncbi:asparaginase [Rubrivivax benzoatilyticus]|uniref:Asparaginase n=1 Tax=Rubrivivax benzoatilyticus TaxID=316997 RepID=A0ABX0I0T7_9BURK|nr:asparaginase [Rubrivivax benzoatilyticus]EGJ11669.1 L-asparaginase II [Rubrivivax benzoatilyticus JA2 = ATCC BAA-35]NHK99732.1 asparaginase [Rubrivivax benzoatilyticus]NHL25605.1 asparaginase [Rubrivivax benzoatilyticus]
MTANPTLVEALRGGAVESTHRGAWAVVDADGDVVASAGDIDRPIFPRSAVKLLQALPLVESGAAERYGLNDEQLAIACASHNGEPRHVAVAASMLAAAGVDDAALECGAHWPYRDLVQREMAAAGQTPGALHNNCSGKHAGFVCLGCLLAGDADKRAFLSGYVKPEHPVMREVGDAIEAATGWRLADAPRGTDGCSIPTYAIPLRHLALAFARAGSGIGLREGRARAAKRLMAAVTAEPFMVGGSGRFDTRIIERLGERVFCKVGAEGVFCAAFPKAGLGVAVKMDDGASRACEVVMAALIERFVRLDEAERGFVHAFADQPLANWNGLDVGRLRWAS